MKQVCVILGCLLIAASVLAQPQKATCTMQVESSNYELSIVEKGCRFEVVVTMNGGEINRYHTAVVYENGFKDKAHRQTFDLFADLIKHIADGKSPDSWAESQFIQFDETGVYRAGRYER